MRSIIRYFVVAMLAVGLLTACFDDMGNYDYTELPDFFVDTTGIKTTYVVPLYTELNIESGLVYDGDKSDLSFSWRAYYKVNPGSENPAVTLAETENLAAPVVVSPGSYWLEFCATEKKTGRTTTFRHSLTVESTGAGFLVLYQKNGVVDCDLVKTRLLIGDLSEDVVSRHIYTLTNPDYPLMGNPVAIGMYSNLNMQFISVYTDRDGIQLSPYDMSLTKKFENLFVFPPQLIKPEGYTAQIGVTSGDYESSDGVEILINDGVCYFNAVVISAVMGKEAVFAKMTGDYIAAPYPLFIPGASIIYDQKNMRYMSAGIFSGDYLPMNGSSTAPFDFSNIQRKLVCQSFAFGGSAYVNAVFRNPEDDGKRYLYIMNFSPAQALYLWDISDYERIAESELFAFGRRGPLAFYAAGNKVYRIPYDMAKGEVGKQAIDAWPYIPDGEDITCLKLCQHPGRNVSDNAVDRYLLIATYNETSQEGKLYFIRVDVASGICEEKPAAVFNQFGKIKDITFKF